MDRINEVIAWITLAFGWWLYKSEYRDGNNNEPEKVPAAMNIVPNETQPLVYGQIQSKQLHGESIISSGLSDLMKKKSRLNKGRRVEDRQAVEQ